MTAVAKKHEQTEDAAAPEVGAAASGDSSLHHVIALSAAPAPPAPVVNVPQGNLAARVAISPDGKQPGAPGGAEHGVASNGGAGGSASSNGGAGKTGGGNATSLPAAVSVTGGNSHSSVGGNGSSAGRPATKLNLKPMATPDEAPARRSASTIGAIDPRLPPESVLSSSEVFTLHIDMPNLTSYSGSWIVKFAELQEGNPPYHHEEGTLSGPEPVVKVDPKYPQNLIKERVDGEVVLYAIIRKDGSVDSIQVIRNLDPALDKNSMDALSRWVFRPATRAGKPVDCEAIIHIPFRFRPN
jgi:TonB family protein